MFVDLNMPGMNGFELLKALVETDMDLTNTKILILTSSVHPDDRKRAAGSAVVSGYLEKPLGLDVLTKLAEELAQ